MYKNRIDLGGKVRKFVEGPFYTEDLRNENIDGVICHSVCYSNRKGLEGVCSFFLSYYLFVVSKLIISV
jgi:hypothetical protein